MWRKKVNRIQRAAEVLGVPKFRNPRSLLAKIMTVVLAIMGLGLNSGIANAATLSAAKVALSDPRPSTAAVTYTFTGSSVTSANIKCVKLVFATTPAGEVNPTGFAGTGGSVTAASSTLINSSATGWSLLTSDGAGASAGSNNVWKYTNTTGVIPGTLTAATFVAAGITNSSTADTGYYLRLSTFDNVDCATTPRDNANVQFINTNGSTLSLTIDNTLTFTVNAVAGAQSCNGSTSTQASTATTIPFGTVTAAANQIVCQDLTAATNATNGYTIFARYTAKPTNALTQTIADWTGTNAAPTLFSAPGTEAYGYTTNSSALGTGTPARFTTGGPKYAAMTTANNEVAYQAGGVTSTTTRVGHEVGVSLTTLPGTYTTTVIYTCTPIY